MSNKTAFSRRQALVALASVPLAAKSVASTASSLFTASRQAPGDTAQPHKRFLAATSAIGNSFVVVSGGYGLDPSTLGSGVTQNPLASTQIYNSLSDAWIDTADLNYPRAGHASVTLRDNRVLVIGGQGFNGPITSIEAYSIESNIWTYIGDISVGRNDISVAVLGQNIVVSGDGLAPEVIAIPSAPSRGLP